MNFQCEIKEQDAQPVLSIRARTPIDGLPQLLGESYGKIAGYLAELGEEPAGAPFAVITTWICRIWMWRLVSRYAKSLAGKG